MKVAGIPFRQTTYFSDLICDYLDEKEHLKPFYHRYPHLENFEAQIAEKKAAFPLENREVLSKALENQYANFEISKGTKTNIIALNEPNTFTVVTGHQLNLFSGPLYFLYKIVSTINLTRILKKNYPQYHFVPVYWMATEDHDFEEINYFNYDGKKIRWNREASGAVGKLDTNGLEAVFAMLEKALGNTTNAATLKQWFTKAYLEHSSLTDATRYLANALFGDTGLVIVDGDDKALKQLLVPYVKKDILENSSFKKVTDAIEALRALSEPYKIQVNPREINYFYLIDGVRERLIEKDNVFYVNDTSIEFSKEDLLKELEQHPERFSPNVIARPLYQEVILPNLCYIGGGGELAYWLELKTSFASMEVTFPMLLLRNSALVISEKQEEKANKLGIEIADMFLKQNDFINKRVREISNIDIDFTPQRAHLQEQFKEMYHLAAQTDPTFLGAVKAQEVKQLKGLQHLEKRLLKAQKRKLKDQVVRLVDLQNAMFPAQSLQERTLNFSELYLESGDALISMLLDALDPLNTEFSIITI